MTRKAAAQFERRDDPIKIFVTIDDLRAILAAIKPCEPHSEGVYEAIGRIEEDMLLALKADAIEYR